MAGRMPEMSDIIIQSSDVDIDKSEDGLLGKGGYGSVYSAKYKNKKVAVKMLSDEGNIPKQQRHDLKTEARRLRTACEHPYILDLIGVVMETNNYSLVLEYMHFGTSISFIRHYLVGAPLRVQFAQQVISAMAWLHSKTPPVKHLDLKAENVLINNCFTAKISDFGLSEWRTVTMAYSKTQPIQKGGRCGTLSHIPPEVFIDINKKGAIEEDVYAFAVTLWEIFSGKAPFANCGNKYELISNAVLNNQRPDLNLLVRDCPQQIRDMIILSWDHQPEKRPKFQELKPHIEQLYNSVRNEIHEHIKYIRAQIEDNFESDPEENREYYECTKHFDTAENVQNGFTNGQASPDGDNENRGITVPPTLPSLRSEQNNIDKLEKEFPKLSFTESDQHTLTPGQVNTQPRQPLSKPSVTAIQPTVIDHTQAPEEPETLRNLGPAHVPISETRPKQIYTAGVRNGQQPDSSQLSGFVSVRNKQYTPGTKMPHPHGPIAQPVSTVLGSETGRQAVEGVDEGTSLKGDVVNDFIRDLSISNPDMLETLMKMPEALENVLSFVQSSASGLSTSSRPGELSHPVAAAQARLANSCSGEVNQEIPTLNGSVSVDQFSGQTSHGRKEESVPATPVQQTAASEQTADTVKMFPAPRGGQTNADTSSQVHPSILQGQPSAGKSTATPNAPPFVTPGVPAFQQETPRQTFIARPSQPSPQRQTIFGQPLRVQLPAQNQFLGRTVQSNAHGSQQVVNKPGSHHTVSNSIFGQPLRTNQGGLGQAYVQPLSGIPVSSKPQVALPKQRQVPQHTALPQQKPSMQQTVSAQPAQPAPQIPDPTQRQHQIGSQQTAIPGVSAPRARSPVEISDHLRPDQTSHRQDQPAPNQNLPEPVQERTGQQTAAGMPKQPITVFHKHAGGGSTTITMDADSELPPNLQIGNNNYMVVNGGSDKKKQEKKNKQKCRKSQLTTNTDELSMDHIDMVSVEIGKDWKRLCRELDMTEADIEQLQFDYHVSGLYEIMYQGIQRWVQRNGRAANVKRMAEALWEVDRDDIALRLH